MVREQEGNVKKYLVLLLVLIVTACAPSRGFDRGNLRGQIADKQVVTEEDIKKALELKPQLPSPFKLAVYFAPPKEIRTYYHGRQWQWSGEDKDLVLAMGTELKSKNMLSDIFSLTDSIVEGNDNRAIRLAAARAGADAVLIVNGAGSIDRYNNAWGASYILLVTPFFIPGTVADGLVMVNATMWDVKNQYLYLSAEAEGTAKETNPAFFIEEGRIINAAKAKALVALKNELSTRLARMGAN